MRYSAFAVVLLFLSAGPKVEACEVQVALQVLGSGGPIADDARASSGYLLWVDGRARLLIDAGGGVFLRFGEAGADLDDLDAIVLTHLHTDHSADLPALLKGGYFSHRTRPLPVIGPTGSGIWPGMRGFIQGMFGGDQAVFAYLRGFIDGSDGLFEIPVIEIDANSRTSQLAFENDRFRLQAVGVHHGPVPALGLLIETACGKVAISGDQNNDNQHFADLAAGSRLLVVDYAIPPSSGSTARALHVTPQHIGMMAAQADVGHLVLSHLMARSLEQLEQGLQAIRLSYSGELSVAVDLDRFPVTDDRGPPERTGDSNSIRYRYGSADVPGPSTR